MPLWVTLLISKNLPCNIGTGGVGVGSCVVGSVRQVERLHTSVLK